MMRPVPFPQLISLIQGGYKRHGKVFGIPKEKFFNYAEQTESASEQGCFEIFGSRIASPIGPAAGPHTQLAQNILAAYLTGARFMELKTVQTLDGEELSKCIARPCIAVPDEGYNVEWSTELTVDEARAEYIKAWFLCHIFAKEFRIASGFVFNMSVGYSYDGIKSAKIDSYIEGLKNARNTEIWNDCYNYIAANIDMFNSFNKDDLAAVSPHVSNNITLSTLHGCPREEIEKIAAYLITEKGLHTYVKCNPTLLGYETARRLLDEAGFTGISFDDHHFKNDLQLTDAVEMLGRLRALASEHRLDFGVKLTNTFPVQIKRNELPGNEMYMSGRSLFHLSINVAKKLSDAFNGGLPISYSGGADYFNAEAILETGIRPVTVATELLKPGGYERFNQLAELAQKTKKGSSKITSIPIINLKALNNLAVSFSRHPRYKKEYRQGRSQRSSPRRTKDSALPPIPLFDCFKAPCADSQSGCPISQDIPRYLAAVAEGDYRAAFAIIARDNTAPSITGTVCDHRCQQCCTRADYEDPLQIRQAKLIAADNAQEAFIESLQASELKTGKSAAIIGAGPAGIAAAVFLRRNGVPVTVYEKRDRPFGMAQYVIPAFRISDAAIRRDFLMAQKYGVEFVFNVPEEYSIPELRKKHEFIVLATGAWRESPPLAHGKMVIGALRFLEDSKKTGCGLDLGKRVAVIGGGDVAMDCARAAIRNRGVEQAVIVYRRTREFMPAQHEEQVQALADGVIFRELLAPVSFSGGVLRCEVMRLGGYDESGRRGIEGTGSVEELYFDTVIGAAGYGIDTGALTSRGIAINDKGPVVNAAGESSVPGVYITGDCASGAATVVKAIAGGKAAAADILRKLGLEADFSLKETSRYIVNKNLTTHVAPVAASELAGLFRKKGIIDEKKTDSTDASRCLTCDTLCVICADVCPNRANVVVEIPQEKGGVFAQPCQIVHIDQSCNECGNCACFCPHSGKPYKEKLTVFSGVDDFSGSENPGFVKTGDGAYKIRLEDKSVADYRAGENTIPDRWKIMIQVVEGEGLCY